MRCPRQCVLLVLLACLLCGATGTHSARKAKHKAKAHSHVEDLGAWYPATVATTDLVPNPTVAFCITGQRARLEVSTKLEHLFRPQLRAGGSGSLHVFWVLASGAAFFSTADTAATAALAPATSEELLRNATAVLQQWSVPVTAHEYLPPPPPACTSPTCGLHAARVRMVGGWKTCMDAVRQHEQANGRRFDAVMKLREDTFLLQDFDVRPHVYTEGLVPFACLRWAGGMNDHVFVVMRRSADVFFETLLTDLYTQSLPHNTERHLVVTARRHNISIQPPISLCQLPFAPIRGYRPHSHVAVLQTAYLKLLHKAYDCECAGLERVRQLLAALPHEGLK